MFFAPYLTAVSIHVGWEPARGCVSGKGVAEEGCGISRGIDKEAGMAYKPEVKKPD
jgi:hypothetical protein